MHFSNVSKSLFQCETSFVAIVGFLTQLDYYSNQLMSLQTRASSKRTSFNSRQVFLVAHLNASIVQHLDRLRVLEDQRRFEKLERLGGILTPDCVDLLLVTETGTR